MNTKLSLIAGFIVLAVVACGDDDDGSGTSGTAGTSVAGASGSTAGTTSAGAAGSTAGSTAGVSGNAGASGASGAAGATGTETLSCDHPPTECDEYDKVDSHNVDLVKGLCNNGTPGTACPTAGLVGKCTSPGGLANLVQFYYVGDADSLKESCENDPKNTWSAP